MKERVMKYFLSFVLLVAVLISSGCISENKNTVVTQSQTPPTIEQTTVITIVQSTSTITASNTDTLCGELVYCGYAPAGFETQPIKSSRCDQLYTLRLQNDQKVMQCLKNPYEATGNNAVERLHCMQGIGTVEDCARYGIKLDHDNGNVIN